MSISEPMHRSKPESEGLRGIEVFTGAGRRRKWTADEKAAFVAGSHVAGSTTAALFSPRFNYDCKKNWP